MRSETEIKNLILEFSKQDERIRAVLLNGSRANQNIKPDKLQDFDIVFVVDNLESFTINHSWTNIFGERILFQLPDEMTFGNKDRYEENISFAYLMLFKDGNRIDLTLFPKQKLTSDFKRDSLTILWLDKDNLFTHLPQASDKDYHIQKPTEKEFLDTCNEFWWVSTYVGKGLLRDKIIYAKEMLETVVRPMFMKVIEWKVGIENNFDVSIGKSGSFLRTFVPGDFHNKVLLTYSNFETEENWKALFLMTEIFQQTSDFIADKMGFAINREEQQNTLAYLKKLHDKVDNFEL
ncbi:aminoglycoside 6-adenylyltransferase [Segetibacter koreensis]|uniref:aminoglycoside 6-adenylyltransferase n=1 Tax=Segetibacter koreensis TaxID=398037 RepID=UPI00036F6FF6|nr:aminoglycoside 6-adenylyltransferase [Segetibacter koreensis]